MLKLRKGDLWKAVALVLAMAAPVWFIVRTLRAASGSPSAAQSPPQAATSDNAQNADTGTGVQAGSRLFAERPRTPMADVARAKIAPDPFRPYVSARPGSEGEPETASEPEPPTPSPLTSDLPELRLTGIISDTRQPLAAFSDGNKSYYVSVGEVVTGGLRLIRIGNRSVTLARNDQRVELRLSQSPSAGRE